MPLQSDQKQILLWKELNKRQQLYLIAIYESDQENEKKEKEWVAALRKNRPADEWRWLKYGFIVGEGPSPLLKRIQKLKMVDQGTGSTFEALKSRGFILMKHEDHPINPIPWIRITPKGRKIIRFTSVEKRPPKLPTGTLREWHWKACNRKIRMNTKC